MIQPEPLIPAPSAESADSAESPFTATVERDDANHTWLVRQDGQRWRVDEDDGALWSAFAGRRVELSGARVDGPAGETRFRVDRLTTSDEDAVWRELGPARRRKGTISIAAGEPGSKMADETWPIFTPASGGPSYQLANHVELAGLVGRPVELRARTITRSPFTAHMPGPTLWVLELAPAP